MNKKLPFLTLAVLVSSVVPSLATITDNTTLGTGAGENISTGTNNVMLGQGGNISSGSSNILIGNNLTGTTASTSNQIDIGDTILGTIGHTFSLPAYSGYAISTTTAAPAQGDILYYSGSAWTDLGAGTAGQVLSTQGASANPQWVTPTPPNYTYASGFLNKFRNGSMQVSQRFLGNVAQTLSTSADAYWIDGWIYHVTGTNVTGYWHQAPLRNG